MTTSTDRVIVGVDGSPASLAALRRAAWVATCRGLPLWLVTGVTLPDGAGASLDDASATALPRIWDRRAEALLDDACARALADFGENRPQIVRRIVHGAVGAKLAATATSAGDLIVLGAPARGRLRRIVSGPSTAWQCVRTARCPVFLVRPGEEPAADANPAAGRSRRSARSARSARRAAGRAGR
ncbi:universal stress protein [Kitasatospora sp. NPDC089797]|uniref:universal stress protein n=1 Tax=Kitasatospora sp. NPDC089797 TaxID=3155298 RepID=UPI003448790E